MKFKMINNQLYQSTFDSVEFPKNDDGLYHNETGPNNIWEEEQVYYLNGLELTEDEFYSITKYNMDTRLSKYNDAYCHTRDNKMNVDIITDNISIIIKDNILTNISKK
jgi:hypothetical protein